VVPDAVFDGPFLSLATDVSVVFAEADSYLPKVQWTEANRANLELDDVKDSAKVKCQARAKVKSDQYAESCAAMDVKFEPFVLESHGFMHSSAVRVIERLAIHCCDVLGRSRLETVNYFKRRTAIALQRGNALLDRTALQRSRNSYGAALAMGMVAAPSDAAAAAGGQRKRGARGGRRAAAAKH